MNGWLVCCVVVKNEQKFFRGYFLEPLVDELHYHYLRVALTLSLGVSRYVLLSALLVSCAWFPLSCICIHYLILNVSGFCKI